MMDEKVGGEGGVTTIIPACLDYDETVEHPVICQIGFGLVLRIFKEKPIKAPKAFLFATARNIALNTVRAGKVRGESVDIAIDDAMILDESADVQESIARNQELELLTRAIQSLPRKCRRIITLSKVYGMSPKAIAEELGTSVQTVYTQLGIGIDRCSAYMKQHCD